MKNIQTILQQKLFCCRIHSAISPSSPPMFFKVQRTRRHRKKVILTSSNLCRQIATDCYGRSAVFLLISKDHPLNEVVAVLKTLLVLQHLSELCDHLGGPATKEITLNGDVYCTVITENKIWYTVFLKYYSNTGSSLDWKTSHTFVHRYVLCRTEFSRATPLMVSIRCEQVCTFYDEALMILQDCFVIGVKESYLCQIGSEKDIIFYVTLP